MRYDSTAALREALETRLATRSRESGVDLQRLRRLVVFERLLVRLVRSGTGPWVLKGGTALEVRFGDRARATKDLDLALQDPTTTGEQCRALLVESLTHDPGGDGFEFRVGPVTPLRADEAGRPGWRFAVQARLAGKEFARVRVDVVARPDELAATQRLGLPGALAFAGLESETIEVVSPEQHFAEKLHALTREYGDRPSSRVKDLADLVLLIADGLAPQRELLDVVRHVFAVRATHPIPRELPDPPAGWVDRYAELAAELNLDHPTLAQATAALRSFWAAVVAIDDQEHSDG